MLTNTVSCVQSAVSMEHNGSSVSNAILPNSIRHFNTGQYIQSASIASYKNTTFSLVELYQKQIQNTHPPFPGPEVAIQPIQSSTLYPSNNCTAEAIPSIKLRNQPISHVQQPRQRGKPLLSKIYEYILYLAQKLCIEYNIILILEPIWMNKYSRFSIV